MNGGALWSSNISCSDWPVWVQGMDMLVNGRQLLFDYEWIPCLPKLVERDTYLRLCLHTYTHTHTHTHTERGREREREREREGNIKLICTFQ